VHSGELVSGPNANDGPNFLCKTDENRKPDFEFSGGVRNMLLN